LSFGKNFTKLRPTYSFDNIWLSLYSAEEGLISGMCVNKRHICSVKNMLQNPCLWRQNLKQH